LAPVDGLMNGKVTSLAR